MTTNNPIKFKWPKTNTSITTKSGMKYTIGTLINNTGGFGLLYDGFDTFGNSVAVKIFKPKGKFLDVKRQWRRETAILDRVRHPNVVFIHDAFICNNLFYIIFERALGNLDDLINQRGPLEELTVREIARQLLFALHYIHNKSVLHKDLTAYNILYFQDGAARLYKVSDFGISEDFTDRGTGKSTNPIAHQLFRPPELVKFGYTSIQSDLYHLGLILYYCLTGNFPYDITLSRVDINKAILTGVPRRSAESLGTSFGDFIAILLRRRDKYRFKTALGAWDYLRRNQHNR